jgi:Type II secretion system (T2SS), protein G
MRNNRKHWVSISLVTGFTVFVFCAWIIIRMLDDFIRVPPPGLARTTMLVIENRIFIYIHEHGQIPQNLGQLSNLDGYYNSIRDGWGNPILYFVDTNGVITLKSFGADRQPGGIDQSEDIIQSFPTRDSNGNWLQ